MGTACSVGRSSVHLDRHSHAHEDASLSLTNWDVQRRRFAGDLPRHQWGRTDESHRGKGVPETDPQNSTVGLRGTSRTSLLKSSAITSLPIGGLRPVPGSQWEPAPALSEYAETR